MSDSQGREATGERPGRSPRTGGPALAVLANALTDAEWQTRVPKDGRTVGVTVHHVASVYPLEIQLAQTIAGGKPMMGVTMEDVHTMALGSWACETACRCWKMVA